MNAPGKAKIRPAREALLLPYQAKWVQDNSRLKIAEKSRQIGWSWATAYSITRRKSLKEARLDAWISSRDEIQARLFLEDCKEFARLLQLGAEDLGETAIDDDGHTAFVLSMANRLRIHSMSSNPDAQAGKRGDRILDEFALHPDPRRLYAIAYPGITWGGSLEIFSTHRGSINYFNDLIREVRERGNPKGFSLHRITLQDALDQGFLSKLQAKLPPDDPRQEMDEAAYFDFVRRGCPDEETWQQEYMCLPADDESAFLTYDLIAACEYPAGSAWETDLPDAKGELFVGVDIGRKHDLTVICVLELLGDVYHTRRIIELANKPFDLQESILYGILSLPQVRRCCIDQTGLGLQFAERAIQRFGQNRVEGIPFTAGTKEQMAFPVKSALEDRKLRIPFSQALRSDLRAIRKTTTIGGNIRFNAERGQNGHADRFWALALALTAGKPASIQFGAVVA